MNKTLTTVTATALTTSALLFSFTPQFAIAETAPNALQVSADDTESSENVKKDAKIQVVSNDEEVTQQQIVVNGQIKTVEITDDEDIDSQLDAVLEEDEETQSNNNTDASKDNDSSTDANETSKPSNSPSKGNGSENDSNNTSIDSNGSKQSENGFISTPNSKPQVNNPSTNTKEVKDRAKAYANAKKGDKTYIEKDGNQIRVWSANTKEQVYEQLAQQGIDVGQLGNGKYYLVQWGDTLDAISRATNIELHKIVSDNNIENIDLIFEGQSLLLRR